MNLLGKAMLGIFGILTALASHIITMIFGWGLIPVSWPWIIAPTIVTTILVVIIQMVNNES